MVENTSEAKKVRMKKNVTAKLKGEKKEDYLKRMLHYHRAKMIVINSQLALIEKQRKLNSGDFSFAEEN